MANGVGIAQQPLDLVRLCLDEEVYIKCKSNRELTGKLHAFDQHLNLVLGDVEEVLTYLETDPTTLEESIKVVRREFEMLFVRGDAVILVSPN